ncbi:MAG: hypothetical protein EXR75_07950 [Myxococcales bacterium]|nr:hypothetical protein [Myxococcales bacterium]
MKTATDDGALPTASEHATPEHATPEHATPEHATPIDDTSALAASMHQARRAELFALIPPRYNFRAHLVIPSLLTAFICAVAASFLRDLRGRELAIVPAMLVVTNGGEWLAHKYLLHGRIPFLEEIYVRHELHHHVAYTHQDMAMRHARELWMILVPAYAVLILLVVVAPFAVLAGVVFSVNCGLFVTMTALTYFIAYEWLHLSYHLPLEHPISRHPIVARLRRLHATHHDPALMKRFNFNVTIGLFDWLLGTLYDPARARNRAEPTHP